MFTRRALTGLVALGALGASAAKFQAQAQTAGARRAEVEALRHFAEITHPRGREAAADADWRARWDGLAADADTLSDGRYFVRTRRALAWFKDGHTTVLPFEFVGGVPQALAAGPFGRTLPWRVRVFDDGAYVTDAKDEAAPLNGARVTRIGSMSADAFVRAVAEQWPGNDAWAHRWAGYHFGKPALVDALGASTVASGVLAVEAMRGSRRIRARLRPRTDAAEALIALPRTLAPCEAWAAEAGVGNFARVLDAERALYISLDDMADIDGKSFEAFTRECFEALEAPAPQRLVLDLRRNGGGNNFLPEALRKRIARSRFNRPGGLYVLTSPMTFSAAQNTVTRIERETFAIFVGAPTGGAPNHFGDASLFTGQSSGLVSMVSTLAWFDSYPQDHRTWTTPDILVPATFADWAAGLDPALERALSDQADEPAEDWNEDRVFFYRRPSQAADWRPFWRAG